MGRTYATSALRRRVPRNFHSALALPAHSVHINEAWKRVADDHAGVFPARWPGLKRRRDCVRVCRWSSTVTLHSEPVSQTSVGGCSVPLRVVWTSVQPGRTGDRHHRAAHARAGLCRWTPTASWQRWHITPTSVSPQRGPERAAAIIPWLVVPVCGIRKRWAPGHGLEQPTRHPVFVRRQVLWLTAVAASNPGAAMCACFS